jgi:hypothetical protein
MPSRIFHVRRTAFLSHQVLIEQSQHGQHIVSSGAERSDQALEGAPLER